MIAERLEARRQRNMTTPDGAVVAGEPQRGEVANRLGGLVLARGLNESIVIGRAVVVEVVGAKSQSARLRIAAPRSVAVHRREVFDAIRLGGLADDALAPVAWDRVDPNEEVGGLVLSRRAGQSIVVGGEVIIEVVEARPGGVRLRVVAPRSVSVHRREVFDAIEADRKRVEGSGSNPVVHS